MKSVYVTKLSSEHDKQSLRLSILRSMLDLPLRRRRAFSTYIQEHTCAETGVNKLPDPEKFGLTDKNDFAGLMKLRQSVEKL